MQMAESTRGCAPAQQNMRSRHLLACTSRFSAAVAELPIYRQAPACCVSHTLDECVGYHTLTKKFVCGTLSNLNFPQVSSMKSTTQNYLSALRFPRGKDPCGIPQGHRRFSLWDFFPQGTFIHFKDPGGIL